MNEKIANTECANCGWSGKRKTGNIVDCPDCGRSAGFALSDEDRERIFANSEIDHFRGGGKMVYK